MRAVLILAVVGLAAVACRDPDRPSAPVPAGHLVVDSDPRGAQIYLGETATGLLTPDTLYDLVSGTHDIGALLDSAGFTYGYIAEVEAPPKDSVRTLLGPILLPCRSGCSGWSANHDAARVRYAANPAGNLFWRGGSGLGLQWPTTALNSYASIGMPTFAAVVAGTADTVSLGPYDYGYLAGRPAPTVTDDGTTATLRKTSWVVPSAMSLPTARGVEIEQHVIGSSAVEDVLVVRLVFRNITNVASYRAIDRGLPPGGITYSPMYLGFILDADVGSPSVSGSSSDDIISYDPSLDLVFTYDSDFAESGLAGGWGTRPGLVGLRMLSAPAGTTTYLNAWMLRVGTATLDWYAGQSSESQGWGWLTASQTALSDHADPRIGYAPSASTAVQDYRMVVSAGPLTLAPGDSAAITVAVVLAEPQPGTFTSGQAVPPGDPFDTGRPIHTIASLLRQKADASSSLLP